MCTLRDKQEPAAEQCPWQLKSDPLVGLDCQTEDD